MVLRLWLVLVRLHCFTVLVLCCFSQSKQARLALSFSIFRRELKLFILFRREVAVRTHAEKTCSAMISQKVRNTNVSSFSTKKKQAHQSAGFIRFFFFENNTPQTTIYLVCQAFSFSRRNDNTLDFSLHMAKLNPPFGWANGPDFPQNHSCSETSPAALERASARLGFSPGWT